MTTQRRLLVLLMTTLMLAASLAGCLGGDDGGNEPEPSTDNGGTTDPGTSDSDGDGVIDLLDQCPNEAGPLDSNDRPGCPNLVFDADSDGVPDEDDSCAETPAGEDSDANGCSQSQLDTDGDSVSDADDQCPDTPAGVKVDAFGCPGDTDADGVTDDKDQCPNTPFGWQVDGRGCALPVVFRDVNFAFDSAKLGPKARATLEKKVVPLLRSNPGVKIRVVGHTDSIGAEGYNQKLSEARAASVARYLFSRGVRKDRMKAQGKGESDPVAPNSVEAGRAANRRVEMFAIK